MASQDREHWVGEGGRHWLAHIDRFEAMIKPVGEALIEKARFRPGEKVVDVGCGGGVNSLQIARLVSPGGKVLGIDVAHILIEHAERRAWETGVENVQFYCADAENAQLPMSDFDRLFARFGVMFFCDTARAFAHMRSWLRPGGSIIFSCWAPVEDNPWYLQLGQAVSKYVQLPPRAPDDPGPFRLADPNVTRAMLLSAGFVDVAMDLWKGLQPLGGEGSSPERAAEFMIEALPLARPAETIVSTQREALKNELATLFAEHHDGHSVRVSGAAWFVTAYNPG